MKTRNTMVFLFIMILSTSLLSFGGEIVDDDFVSASIDYKPVVYKEKIVDTELEYNEDGLEIVEKYEFTIPDELSLNMKYNKYEFSPHYVVALYQAVNIRKLPTTDASIVRRGYVSEKFNVIEKVKGQYFSNSDSDEWYKLYWTKNGEKVYGYVYAPIVTSRDFEFDAMYDQVDKLKHFIDSTNSAYISNYKNYAGRPPLHNGKTEDAYGALRDQSASAYLVPEYGTEVRYAPDGSLLHIMEELEEFYKVKFYDFDGIYYVPKPYVSFKNAIQELKKVIVVSVSEQNEAVFEHNGENWEMISYSLATTGGDDEFRLPTVPGHYMAIETRSKFLYLDDHTKEIAGYAPYAIRFNGGAYIHGVPVNYKLVKQSYLVTPAVLDENGVELVPAVYNTVVVDRVDPGMAEVLGSLGTYPKSHKCVRNYTSHAKFLYEWATIGETAVIVIE